MGLLSASESFSIFDFKQKKGTQNGTDINQRKANNRNR